MVASTLIAAMSVAAIPSSRDERAKLAASVLIGPDECARKAEECQVASSKV